MVTAIPKIKIRLEEYLTLKKSHFGKHELFKEEIVAMADAGNNYNIITANLNITIRSF
jgi:hypothetical protein